MARIIATGSPEHMMSFTDSQLCTLAASTDPAHVVAGYAAECELALREVRDTAWAEQKKALGPNPA